MKKPTLKRLKQLLHYDPLTGLWTWRVHRSHKIKVGDRAGHIGGKGYWVVKLDYINYRSSRLAHFYMTGKWPKHQMDHKNRVRLDDRWENLRDLTPRENSRNRHVKLGPSGIRGVRVAGRRFTAGLVDSEGTTFYLGIFDTKQQAASAYDQAHKRLFGPPDHTAASSYIQGQM